MYGSMVFFNVLANVERSEMGLYEVFGCCFSLVLEWYDVSQLPHVCYDVGVNNKCV